MKILVISKLENVNKRFEKAIWRKTKVNRYYNSAKEAKEYHNLRNCEYQYENEYGEIISYYNNARLDSFGRRLCNKAYY